MALMLLLAAWLTCVLATPNTLDTMEPAALRSLQNLLRLTAVEVLAMSALGDLVRMRVFLIVDAVCCAMQLHNFSRACAVIFPEQPFLPGPVSSSAGGAGGLGAYVGTIADSCGLRLGFMLALGAYIIPATLLYVLEMRSRRAFAATLAAAARGRSGSATAAVPAQ